MTGARLQNFSSPHIGTCSIVAWRWSQAVTHEESPGFSALGGFVGMIKQIAIGAIGDAQTISNCTYDQDIMFDCVLGPWTRPHTKSKPQAESYTIRTLQGG